MIAIRNRLIMLIPKRSSYHQLAVVFTLILLLTSLGTISSCGKKSTPPTTPSSSNQECNSEVCGATESTPIANQPLALARYSIIMKIRSQYEGIPLPGKTTFTRDDVLFPRGKSDKVYILIQGHESLKSLDENNDVVLLCYKSKGKGVRLLYYMKLKAVHKPPKDRLRVRNMLDYLSLLGISEDPEFGPTSYVVPGNISKWAKRDLSLSQDLVAYSYVPYIGVLYVQCFNSKVTESIDELKYMQSFVIAGMDPWYEKYGFPLANCELTVIDKEKKGK